MLNDFVVEAAQKIWYGRAVSRRHSAGVQNKACVVVLTLWTVLEVLLPSCIGLVFVLAMLRAIYLDSRRG